MSKTRRQIIKEKMESIDGALERAEEHLIDVLSLINGLDDTATRIVMMTATLVKEVREHVRKMREEFGW